jgi:hypothetical protein
LIGTLSVKRIPRLLARFPNRGLRLHQGKEPLASFPAAHPEVGDLEINDDGEELTTSVGQLTHGHFSPTNYQEPSQKKEEEVIDRVPMKAPTVSNDCLRPKLAPRTSHGPGVRASSL